MLETGDAGLDQNPRAVLRCLGHNALELIVAGILELGRDTHAVADAKGLGVVGGELECSFLADPYNHQIFLGRGLSHFLQNDVEVVV